MASALISIDGVAGFDIQENYITHSGAFGIWTRLSSGRVQGNVIIGNRGVGCNFTGGSDNFPARLKVLGNRVLDNALGGVGLVGGAQTENDRPDLFSAHTFRRVPLPQFYDRTLHPEAVPDKLEAYVEGNLVNGNNIGFRASGYIRDQYRFHPLDPDDETANVTAKLVGNIFNSNRLYGVAVDAAQISAADSRRYVINIDLTSESTTLEANGEGPAFLGFWRLASSVSAVEESNLNFKFAHNSTIRICGDITQLNYENRATDPTDLTSTGNTLTVNGMTLTGSCVPLYDCVFQLPSALLGCK